MALENTYATIRTSSLALTGLSCVAISILAITNSPYWPATQWAPLIIGIAATIIIWLASWSYKSKTVKAAWDERSTGQWNHALKFGYWFAIALYPVFGLLLANQILGFPQAFAGMGLLTGGVPLLYFCYLEVR